MNVLITGAGGQVALELAREPPANVQVQALSRAQLDICDNDAVRAAVAAFTPDVIINAAGYTAVDQAEKEPDRAMRTNAAAPRFLARAALALPNCRFIHISSDYVFGGRSARAMQPRDPTQPLSVYGRSKLEGEQAVIETLGGRSVVLRTSWVYGAYGRNFMLTMIRLMRDSGAVRVVADQIGSPTSTPTLAQVLWQFALRPDISGIYHWSDAGVASWYDFAVAIAEEATTLGLLDPRVQVVPITTEEYPTPAIRPAFSVLDKRATVSALSIAPKHWRVCLREVLRSLKNV